MFGRKIEWRFRSWNMNETKCTTETFNDIQSFLNLCEDDGFRGITIENFENRTIIVASRLTIEQENPTKRIMSEFGTPIKKVTDVKWLIETVEQLYQIADDISTYGDMCKDNDRQFRNLTEKRVTALCERIDCDGYSLFMRKNGTKSTKTP